MHRSKPRRPPAELLHPYRWMTLSQAYFVPLRRSVQCPNAVIEKQTGNCCFPATSRRRNRRVKSEQPPRHFDRDAGTAVGKRPSKQLEPLTAREHVRLKTPEQRQDARAWEHPDEVEGTVKTELRAGRWHPLISEPARNWFGSKAKSPRLEFRPVLAANQHIFGLRSTNRQFLGGPEQRPRA